MYGLETYPDCPVNYNKLEASVKLHEGLRNLPYKDTTGNLTIGYGRNLSVQGISNDEANYLLSSDLLSAIRTAQKEEWWPYVSDNDARSRAAIECVFNLGAHAFGQFTKTISALRARDYDTASVELLNSLWARQIGKRAEVIAQMIKTGSDAGVSTAPPLQS